MSNKLSMYLLALLIVGLNVSISIVLKTLADQTPTIFYYIVGFGLVAVLNVFRLGVWYIANQNFQLSQFHPLTSLIFPAMAYVAMAYGENISYLQFGGVLLISIGVIIMGRTQV